MRKSRTRKGKRKIRKGKRKGKIRRTKVREED